MRHLLTSVLGPRSEIAVDVDEMTLSDGELLLMTTDGMHGERRLMMSMDAILTVMNAAWIWRPRRNISWKRRLALGGATISRSPLPDTGQDEP